MPLPAPSAAAPTDVGYRDFSYGSSVSAPTGQKPQSKLWVAGGRWWGALYSTAVGSFTIHELDWASQEWSDTGVELDPRSSAQLDTLWDGNALYTIGAGTGSSSSDSAYLRRFSYSSGGGFVLDPGFPVTVVDGGMEAGVFDKDTMGTLWFTYTRGGAVYVTHTTNDDQVWATPFVVPVGGSDTLTSDDISAVVAYDAKIGVMWSNQNDGTMYFATHVDGAPPDQWTVNPAVQLPEYADDHMNLKSIQADADGRVYAATKTSLNAGSAPLMLLLVLDGNGNWQRYTVATVAENHTRPLVLIDQENRQLYWFASSPCCSGGVIYYKQTSLDNISFAPGLGTPFIESSTDQNINNITSTKQALDSSTGLVAIASDDHTRYYLHNAFTLGVPGGPPDTVITSGPSGDVAVDSATFSFASTVSGSTFECSLDSAPAVSCTSPTTYSGLSLGAHTFDVAARDPSGQLDPSPAHADWNVVSPGDAVTELDIRISTTADDAEEWESGDINLDSSDLELVEDPGRGNQAVGLRFPTLTVPAGATITDAWIQFQVDEASSGVASLVVQGEDTDDAAPYTTAVGSIRSRPRTAASVAWSPPGWPTVGDAALEQRTPPLPAIVQELIDRPGWASGNAVAFIITGSGTRWAEAYDGDPAGAPQLHVAYSSAPPDPPTISAITPTSGPPGTLVTIDGSDLAGATSVAFNGTAAPYTVVSSTQITATVPGTATSGPVSVTTSGGSIDGPDFTVTEPEPSPAIRVPADQPTIQDAIDAAVDGDVILVAPGTYHESVVIAGKTITLASQYYETGDPSLIESTVLDTDGARDAIVIQGTTGSGPSIVGLKLLNASGTILDGIRVEGSAHLLNLHIVGFDDGVDIDPQGGALGICECRGNLIELGTDDGFDLDGASGGVYEHNVLQNNHEDGIEVRLSDTSTSLSIEIRDNDIRGNGQDGIQIIDLLGASNRTFTIERNRFIANGRAAVGLMDNGQSGEDYRAASLLDRINLFSNTFSGNNHALSGGDNVIGLNNIFANSSQVGVKGVDGGSLLAYSLFWNNGIDVDGSNVDGATTLFADPLFYPDHTLMAGSPAIDAGVASYLWMGDLVLDLQPDDFIGSAPDLGAFEFDPIGPQTTITSGPPGLSASPDATFDFDSSVAGSTFECSLDGAAFAACSPPSTVTGIADGAHEFQVRALDASGNPDLTPASWTWTIDTAAPAAPAFSEPAAGATVTTRTFTVRGTAEAGGRVQLFADASVAAETVVALDGTWATVVNGLGDGPHALAATATDAAGNSSPLSPSRSISVALAPGDPVVAAAGDIACDRTGITDCRQQATSDILLDGTYDAVLTLGDNQYECGSPSEFMAGYDPSWGRVNSITRPAVGNHEYFTGPGADCDATGTAAGYFGYFGSAAGSPGAGWYSYDVGAWHLVALNSNCAEIGGCDAGSAQEQWLRADLAASSAECTLAYWHHPRWSSGSAHGSDPMTQALVDALYEHGAELILAGHDHDFERFAPQAADGTADPTYGIREFVVGTGGRSLVPLGVAQPNSEFRADTDFGILQLTLGATNYDWTFISIAGATLDSGSASCHGEPGSADTTPPDTSITSGPADPSTSADAAFTLTATETGATYECALDGAAFAACTTPATYSGLTDGPHTFAARATDLAGNTDPTPATWSWTIDTSVPSVTGTSPTDGAIDVPLTTSVSATFSEAMDPTSISGATFELTHGGVPMAAVVGYDGGSQVATLTPGAELGTDLTYVATIDGATDLAGNPLPIISWSFTTVPDTTPPDTSITSGPADPSTSADAAFTLTATETGATYECALDGAAFAACTTPATYSGLTDGPHTFAARATDLAGNTDPTPATWSWTIDTSVPPGPVSVTFTPNADAHVREASPGVNYGSATTLITDANDGGGAAEATVRFAVNGVGSTVQQALLRIWVTNKTNNGPTVYLSDATWAEDSVTWLTRPALQGGAVATSGAIQTGWYEFDVTSAVTGSGTYSFTLVPTSSDGLDFSSREGSERPQLVITYLGDDTTPPQTTIQDGPSGLSSSSSATFTFISNELGSTFECAIDGAAFQSCTSPQQYGGLANGDHDFAVRATDASGNTDPTPAIRSWTIVVAESATFAASADTYADERRSTTNFGSSTTIESDGDSGRSKQAFLRFDVTGATSAIVSARIRIWVTNATYNGPEVSLTDTTWDEATLTWDSRPSLVGGTLVDADGIDSGGWYEFDVTSAVTGNGAYSFAFTSISSDALKFASRETSTPPELVVVFGS